MNSTLESIEQAAKHLTLREKATLAHSLLRELDGRGGLYEEVEREWTELAEARLDAYLQGEMDVIDGDEAMNRLRDTIK